MRRFCTFFALLLSLALVLSSVACGTTSTPPTTDSGTTDTPDPSVGAQMLELTLARDEKTYAVTGIGENAFIGCTSLEQVILPQDYYIFSPAETPDTIAASLKNGNDSLSLRLLISEAFPPPPL